MYITNVRLSYVRRSGNERNPGTLIRRLKVLNPKFRSVCLGCRDPVRSLKAETASARRTFLRFAPPEVRYEEKRFLKVFRECEHGARTTSRGRRVSGSARWTIRILCVQVVESRSASCLAS
ncbi:hypothetical protein ALC53_03653 [Atta colombica]|uniref:Uncharacterized protein n=1 Tax=Atta colombica TaxID=520822 RepID=A0A195BNG7_9HYME|nr:hypothetical protein ALC53_03653 [Atta colombica]